MQTDVESGYTGAITHGALVALAAVEAAGFKSKWSKLLAGCCAGWHLFAVYYHIRERREYGRAQRSSQGIEAGGHGHDHRTGTPSVSGRVREAEQPAQHADTSRFVGAGLRPRTEKVQRDAGSLEAPVALYGLRRVLNAIHAGGNIYYDKSRLEAYALIAKAASDLRKETK